MLRVYIEAGTKRTFACALDWPGWCRSARDEAAAIENLLAYAPRYAPIAADAGYPLDRDVLDVEVIEHVPGNGTTDFGAPDRPATADTGPLPPADARRLADLVTAAWRALERTAARAPAELAKGPRGGGRDRDKVLQHVLGAEVSYARKLGVRHREPAFDDTAAIAALRSDIEAAIAAGKPAQDAPRAWPVPYAARRIAWHVIDHAWEIEDRGGLDPARAW
ncbi:MAG: hypothetical protein ACM3S1_15310 [Hyphomicrobiales bacterium]